MKVTFHINYQTQPGQDLFITGSIDKLGNWKEKKAFPMRYITNGLWLAELEIESSSAIDYNYFLRQPDGLILKELGDSRKINPKQFNIGSLKIYDTWFWPDNPSKPTFTAAFTKALMRPEASTAPEPRIETAGLRLSIRAPRVAQGYKICVSGNQEVFGNWDQSKVLLIDHYNQFPLWSSFLRPDQLSFPLHYKYGIYDTQKKEVCFLESGEGRFLPSIDFRDNEAIQQNDELFYYPIPPWRGAGVAIPVFSLRTENGFGVGEFQDLKQLVDWAVCTHLQMIQVLPINDTVSKHTITDSNPYKANSVMALHPMYINLEAIGEIPEPLKKEYQLVKATLNSKSVVDFNRMMKEKIRFLKLLFQKYGQDHFNTHDYKAFYWQNVGWLKTYAVFSYLRDKNATSNFKQWDEKYSTSLVDTYCQNDSDAYPNIQFYFFMQYHLHLQLLDAANYARKNGVVLKGDIPIGIHPESADAWAAPELFKLNTQAGAPPDDFSTIGQNWELPTYNWDVMAQNNYQWWQMRLKKMAEYFDAYRFDHILGFFRIWEIPIHAVQGVLGQFNPAIPLTEEEIEGHGITFKKERFTHPYITKRVLQTLFGKKADWVMNTFLQHQSTKYHFKASFNTQRKVDNYFKQKKQLSKEDIVIRDGLFELLSNVLFVQTPDMRKDCWHPRVAMQRTLSYKMLDKEVRDKLRHLHDHYFYRKHNNFWFQQAMQKLPALTQSTQMLVCGEDLGMVPSCVPPVMDSQGILSLEIERMPKTPGWTFADPKQAPYLSVCTSSSHDMSGIRSWWEKENRNQDYYYHTILQLDGETPEKATAGLCKAILQNHLQAPSIWVTIPIQDLFSIDETLRINNPDDERINVPGVADHAWVYRMHVTIEELMQENKFNLALKSLVELTGRNSTL